MTNEKRKIRLEAHFTCTESLTDGGCWHDRVKIDIGNALDCLTGDMLKAIKAPV